ncbi:AraC family transcriptional regulator [Pseudoalteromonas xiamenensis]
MLKYLSQRWDIIKPKDLNLNPFHFELSHPSGQLSALLQGIWAAKVTSQSDVIRKPLHCDAGSGLMFNFSGKVQVGEQILPRGVILLPVSNVTQHITFGADTRLAGVRFHPAIGFGLLGPHVEKHQRLEESEDNQFHLYSLFHSLDKEPSVKAQIALLNTWAKTYLDLSVVLPHSLDNALESIRQGHPVGDLSTVATLSLRQIERLFKLWLGMTPKAYQRLIRVKHVIDYLKHNSGANLADVAVQFGFSDQAHMTREFSAIARTTPGKL